MNDPSQNWLPPGTSIRLLRAMAGEIEAALLQDSVPDLDRIASHLAMTMHILANEIGHMEIHDHDEQPR